MKTIRIGNPPKAKPNRNPIRVQIPQSLYVDLIADEDVYSAKELASILTVVLNAPHASTELAPDHMLLEIHVEREFMTDLMSIQGLDAIYELALIVKAELKGNTE